MAGDTSIKAQAYYDSPKNPFWKIMVDVFNPAPEELSHSRKEFITGRGIALWDCIGSGVRFDSSDASFSERTLRGNDIQGFLNKHPTIHTIVLNGTSSTVKYFGRYCNVTKPIRLLKLPSTASMITYMKKVEAWSVLKELVWM
jgi:hypoxanthine-DNA glycosylase